MGGRDTRSRQKGVRTAGRYIHQASIELELDDARFAWVLQIDCPALNFLDAWLVANDAYRAWVVRLGSQ